MVGAFIFFAVGWVKAAIERGILPAFPDVIWVLAIAVLLFNNGAMLGVHHAGHPRHYQRPNSNRAGDPNRRGVDAGGPQRCDYFPTSQGR